MERRYFSNLTEYGSGYDEDEGGDSDGFQVLLVDAYVAYTPFMVIEVFKKENFSHCKFL